MKICSPCCLIFPLRATFAGADRLSLAAWREQHWRSLNLRASFLLPPFSLSLSFSLVPNIFLTAVPYTFASHFARAKLVQSRDIHMNGPYVHFHTKDFVSLYSSIHLLKAEPHTFVLVRESAMADNIFLSLITSMVILCTMTLAPERNRDLGVSQVNVHYLLTFMSFQSHNARFFKSVSYCVLKRRPHFRFWAHCPFNCHALLFFLLYHHDGRENLGLMW